MSTIEQQTIQPVIETQDPTDEQAQAAQDKAVIDEAVSTAETSGTQTPQPEIKSAESPAAPDSRPPSMLATKDNMPPGFDKGIQYLDDIHGRQLPPRTGRIYRRKLTTGQYR